MDRTFFLAVFAVQVLIFGSIYGSGRELVAAVVSSAIVAAATLFVWWESNRKPDPGLASWAAAVDAAEKPAIPAGIKDPLLAEFSSMFGGHYWMIRKLMPVLRFVSEDSSWGRMSTPMEERREGVTGPLAPFFEGIDDRRLERGILVDTYRAALARIIAEYDPAEDSNVMLGEQKKKQEAEAALEEAADRKFSVTASAAFIAVWAVILFFAYRTDIGRPTPQGIWSHHNAGNVPAMALPALRGFIAQLPSAAAFDHRASVSLLCCVVAFLAYGALIRVISGGLALPAFFAAVFSLGIYQVSDVAQFVNPFVGGASTCSLIVASFAKTAVLTTEDINGFRAGGCPLPRGFVVNRAERVPQ